MAWDGEGYQERLAARRAAGADMHGEVDFLMAARPASVLDAGCGTGRVAIELARRGVDVVGVDADRSMISTARRLAPQLEWVLGDVCRLDLDRTFDAVVMAGNVPLYTPAGTQSALVAGCARHLAPGGRLVCGFQLDGGYRLADYDEACGAAGLDLVERWATWGREPFGAGARYAVSVHGRLRTT